MPKNMKKVKRELLLSAKRLGLKGNRQDAYVYGTINKIEEASKHKEGAKHNGKT
jgi:hypothetical protein